MITSGDNGPLRRVCWRLIRFVTPKALRKAYSETRALRSFCDGAINKARIFSALVVAQMRGHGATIEVRLPSDGEVFTLRPFTSDTRVVQTLLLEGEYDAIFTELPSAMGVLDLGVNVGASLRLWRSWYPDSVVLGVEPDPESYRLAMLNSRGTSVIQAAVGAQSGRALLCQAGEPWAFRIDDEAREGLEVVVVPITDLFHKAGLPTIDLMKCDIEGAETELFGSCREWIRSVRLIAVETHPPYNISRLLNDISQNGGNFHLVKLRDCGAGNQVGFLRNMHEPIPYRVDK